VGYYIFAQSNTKVVGASFENEFKYEAQHYSLAIYYGAFPASEAGGTASEENSLNTESLPGAVRGKIG